jgi:hypothetical protein
MKHDVRIGKAKRHFRRLGFRNGIEVTVTNISTFQEIVAFRFETIVKGEVVPVLH